MKLASCIVVLASFAAIACGASDTNEGAAGAGGSTGGSGGVAAAGAGGQSTAGGASGQSTAGGASGQSTAGGAGGSSTTGGAGGVSGEAGAGGGSNPAGSGGVAAGGAAGKSSGGAAGSAGAKPVGGSAGAGGASTGGCAPTLSVGKITGATTAELTMIAEGVALANTTMKTPCFKNFVLSAKWTETEGLTQAQIYDKLCTMPVAVDVDMYLGSWYENHVSKTIGYENEPGTVHMNRYFVDSVYMVADNLIHEAEGHSQGFSHYGVKATSVPYGLNDAFEACSPVSP